MTDTTIPPLVKNKRVEGDKRVLVTRAVASEYLAGKSIRKIAAALGRSYGFVHRILREADIEFRPRGGNRRGQRKPL